MRILGATLVLLVACGGGDDAAQPDATPADAAPSCGVTWSRVEVEATSVAVMDAEPGPTGRAVRVAVTVELGGCDELGMLAFEGALERQGVLIGVYVWRPSGVACPVSETRTVTRPVVLDDLPAGIWSITAYGAEPISVTISDDPPACDTSRTACLLDCDCDEAAGERCLSYGSFAGPTSACAVPCELDRDCGGTTCEGDISDGLGHVCTAIPECGAGRACPTGWTCDAGACTPDFTLNSGTRHSCGCDADCDPGLHCAAGRCEALCETAGPWCEGAHVCGEAVADASGLAGVDSVCVWLGE